MTNLLLAWEPQTLYPLIPLETSAPRPAMCSAFTLPPAPHMAPPKLCCVLSPGSVSDKLFFTFPFALLLNSAHC